MTPAEFADGRVRLHHGDCLDVLRAMPDESVDAVVCDPPYGLADHKPEAVVAALTAWASGDRELVPAGKGFMGRDWDSFVPPPAVWDECLRVLKPGGHLVAFAGSRTYDLMGLSIRMAGFEIRDGLQWLQGAGMPKGLNVAKATGDERWSGWNTSLKPAAEPAVLARRPLREKNVAANVLAHGTGALNIDATRTAGAPTKGGGGWAAHKVEKTDGWDRPYVNGVQPTRPNTAGRWPANVLLSHSPDCHEPGECAPNCPVAELGRQSDGTRAARPSGAHVRHSTTSIGNGEILNGGGAVETSGHDGSGASRFFPTFKYQAKAPASERPKIDGKGWPTVKPQGLMRWIVRLITPPGGTVLDPFAGTSSTLQAARDEGFHAIGIERDDFAYQLSLQRLNPPAPAPAPVADPTPAPAPTKLKRNPTPPAAPDIPGQDMLPFEVA